MSAENPRFPHTLALTRVTAASQDDPFAATAPVTLYDGECRSYRNVVTKTRDGVLVSDYVIAMPRVDFAILPGDKVSVEANNRQMEGVVVDSQTTNLGTNIWWNQKEN